MTDVVPSSLYVFAASASLADFPWAMGVFTTFGLALLIYFLFFFRTLPTSENASPGSAVLASVGIPLIMLALGVLVWFCAIRWLPNFYFRGNFPWWVSIPLAALMAVFIFFMYFRESMKIDLARRIIMATLRSVTLAAILLLLCKPVWDYPTKGEKPRPIVVLIDTTESMKQHDSRAAVLDQIRVGIARGILAPDKNLRSIIDRDEPSSSKDSELQGLYPADQLAKLSSEEPERIEVVRSALTNPKLNLLARLKAKGPLKLSTFNAEGMPVLLADPRPDGSWPGLQATQPHTPLFGAIYQSLQVENNELPAAVVVVSDGLNNAVSFEDPEKRRPIDLFTISSLCKKLQIPLYVYGVGGGSSHLLHLKELDVNSTLFVEDKARVRVAWRCRGVKTGEVQVDVALAGKIVATQRYPVKEGEHIEETLTFEPKKLDAEQSKRDGKLNLTATVKLIDSGEKDSFTKAIRVVENKVKLLFVENSPRWEFKFLQRAFLRDRRVDASFILVEGSRETVTSGKPFLPEFPRTREELFKFDLLFIGDVDAAYFSPEQQKWMRDFVFDGGGLVMIAGRQHAPASYFGTLVGDTLPVEFQRIKFPVEDTRRPVEFKPKLSDLGKRSAMMSLADTPEENERIWKSLQGWYWYYPTTHLKSAALTLLEHPKDENADKRPMPLLAMHYFGGGLVLFCATDETWRWRWNEDNEPDKYFSRFWGQVVYQIGLPRALAGRSQLGMSSGEAILGQPGKVYARLFSEKNLPIRADQVPGYLEWEDAPIDTPAELRRQPVVFEAVPNQLGEYVLTLPHDRAGKFVLHVDSQDQRKGAALEFRVTTPPGSENAPGNLDEETLISLARETGGAYYREEDLNQLPDAVLGKTVTYTNPHNSLLLWEQWWVLVLLVGLLTAEWLVRKFSNMS